MIYICSLAEMPAHVRSLRPSHLVSLLSAAEQPPTPDGFAPERHHRVAINDISEPMDGYVLPGDEHIARLIGFLETWDAGAPLLVHCFAGISRSTAAALIALTFRHDGREEEAALRLRRAAKPPHDRLGRRPARPRRSAGGGSGGHGRGRVQSVRTAGPGRAVGVTGA